MASPVSSPIPAPLPAPENKQFRCTAVGCSKSFSRAEHLHRHALNHNETNGTACERCSAVFKRKDLLDRHKARHKEKDEEAGGEGLGKLLTRKRLWKDPNGVIVAKKRPEHEKKRKRSAISEAGSSITSQPQIKSPFQFQNGALLSPPGSSDPNSASEPIDTFGSEAVGSSENGHLSASIDNDQWPISNENLTMQDFSEDSYDFLCNASWGNQPYPTDIAADLPYDDIFAPDTASSFNMPFSTMNYYSWLFGNESWPIASPEAKTGRSLDDMTAQSFEYSSNTSTRSSLREPIPIASGLGDSYDTRLPPIGQEVFGPGFGSSFTNLAPSNAVPPFAEFLAMSQTPEPNWGHTTRESVDRGLSGTPVRFQNLGTAADRYILTPTNSRSGQDFKSGNDQFRKPRKLPVIDDVAREGIIRLVEQAHPKTPDGLEITRDHPFLTLSSIQQFCDVYFLRFNTSYPLLHQATFDPAHVDPLLLIAVIQLGATYSSKDDHLLAVCIHNVMRSQIFGHTAFNTRPTLWMLQTILLVECFGKSRAGQLQHDMSHLFHGLLINLIRRSDCQSARCQKLNDDIDLDSKWRAEVDAEERRRLALLCFMWDTQHAVLFSQSLCMNAAELKLSMPWDTATWDADTAEEWYSISSARQPPPPYLSVLRAYINPDSETRPPQLNGLSRVLALHGLMSVAWDLNRRDQTSLGLAISKDIPWQTRISHSYDAWKTDFDTYTKATLLALEPSPSERDTFQRFSTANIAIYHAAHIILNVDIIDLQIFAGATHILGRPVLKPDRERSRQKIKEWAKQGSMPAAHAVSHAALLLRDGVRKLHNWDAGNVFHYPWCLYLATLTCWAFQVGEGREVEGAIKEGGPDDEDADWDSKAEMNALVSALARARLDDLWRMAGKYRAGDLPRVMVRYLSTIRWAVVQEGMIVLRGLGLGGEHG